MLQREHSAILSTFIKLTFFIKIFVLSIFKWPLKTGLTVQTLLKLSNMSLIQSKSNIKERCLKNCIVEKEASHFGL